MRAVNIFVASIAILSSMASGVLADLKIGDVAPPLSVAKWVKGTPNKLTVGKVHVVEFWATWCGPCKATIPHLTELSKKFKGQADFSGISIWEGNGGDSNPVTIENKVNAFVKEMGAKMDYSIAMDDKITGGTMASKWMLAAGQNGIPSAFIVDQKGKIAWIGHPMEMEKPLAQICAGKWDAVKYGKEANLRMAAEKKMQTFAQQLQGLLLAGKIEQGMALVDTETATDKSMRTQVAMMLNSMAWALSDPKQKLPPQFDVLKKSNVELARKAVALSDGEDGQILDTLAFTLALGGNYQEAAAIQEKAVAKLGADAPAQMKKEILGRLEEYRAKLK